MSDQRAGARQVEKLIQQYGCLPATPDGEMLSHYTRVGFVAALDAEIRKARDYGMPKLTIHMDLLDAVPLLHDMRTI